MKEDKEITFNADVGRIIYGRRQPLIHLSKVYDGWFQLLDEKCRGIEIKLHPKIAKRLGLKDTGTVKFNLKVIK